MHRHRQPGLTGERTALFGVVSLNLACGAAIFAWLLCAIVSFVFMRQTSPISVPTPKPSRTILSATLPVRELWRRPGVVIIDYGLPTGVIASDERVIVVDQRRGMARTRLEGLDSRTGQSLWQIGDLHEVFSFDQNQSTLFVAAEWQIRGYSLADGQLLWSTPGELPGHTGYLVYPVGPELLVYSDDNTPGRLSDIVRTYDVANGALLDVRRIDRGSDLHVLITTPTIDYWTGDDQLVALQRMSGVSQWRAALYGGGLAWPVLTGSSLVVRSKHLPGEFAEISAFDVVTGATRWRYPDKCASNLVLVDSTIYFIRSDGVLVGVDAHSGQELGTITFSGSWASINTTYWVAASTDGLFVYFGDSQELITFAR